MRERHYVLYLWDGAPPACTELILAVYHDLDQVVAARDAIVNHLPDGHAGVRYTTPTEDRVLGEGGKL